MALSDRWSIDLGRISSNNLPNGTTGKAEGSERGACAGYWLRIYPRPSNVHQLRVSRLSVGGI